MPGLVYAFVARDKLVLAEHASLAGNWRAVAIEVLQNSSIADDKFTVTADQYTFNFLVHAGFTFLVVAEEAYGRQIPFACAERTRDAFMEKFADRGRTVTEDGLGAAFGPVIKRQMDYCMAHPEEISKMASVQRKVDEVKGIMMQNVEQVLVRGERLDVLVDRTDDLRDQAQRFQRQGTQLRKRMWWQNFRMQAIVVGVVVLLVVVIFLLSCFTGGRNCLSRGKSAEQQPGSNAAAAEGPASSSDVAKAAAASVPSEPQPLVPGAGAGSGSAAGSGSSADVAKTAAASVPSATQPLVPAGNAGGSAAAGGAPASSADVASTAAAALPSSAQPLLPGEPAAGRR